MHLFNTSHSSAAAWFTKPRGLEMEQRHLHVEYMNNISAGLTMIPRVQLTWHGWHGWWIMDHHGNRSLRSLNDDLGIGILQSRYFVCKCIQRFHLLHTPDFKPTYTAKMGPASDQTTLKLWVVKPAPRPWVMMHMHIGSDCFFNPRCKHRTRKVNIGYSAVSDQASDARLGIVLYRKVFSCPHSQQWTPPTQQ